MATSVVGWPHRTAAWGPGLILAVAASWLVRRRLYRAVRLLSAAGYVIALLFAGIGVHVPLASPVTVAMAIPWIVVVGILWLWRPQLGGQPEPAPAICVLPCSPGSP